MLHETIPEYHSSESSSVESEDNLIEPENEKEDLPPKFDLSKLKQKMEDGPPSSSDDEEDEVSEDEDMENENLESDDDNQEQGSGWADAMAKVLNTGKNSESSKPLLLSKAKKDQPKIVEKKPLERASVRQAKKKEREEKSRKRPNIVKDRTKEKRLVKIATKGVVQLFNLVRDQQKSLKTQLDKAGLSTTKREKVFKNLDKNAFLHVLSNGKTSIASNKNNIVKPKLEIKHEDDDGTWSVLKDNFMMGAKMKDWDKESDDDN